MLDFGNLETAQTLAQAIVNTIPEPFIVLDGNFRVLSASLSFYQTFKLDPAETRGRLLYSLGNNQWDIPALRTLLENIIPQHAAISGFEFDGEFPGLGHRTMLLNAREVTYGAGSGKNILLAFTDVTARRLIEREKDGLHRRTEELLRQKDSLLREMQHRVANSLQIIASILMLKARAVSSEETRQHLKDAHQRVLSVAEVQRQLNATDAIDRIEVSSYLSKLCASLAASMVAESQPIAIEVSAVHDMIGSDKAVSLGLIVTELVINAIKHAFPVTRKNATIKVTYETREDDWKLTVSDNGVGKNQAANANSGLGTAIVQALVQQLNAVIAIDSGATGMTISVTRATFVSST